jgi:transcriptional regulator with XRE-family HTH domain
MKTGEVIRTIRKQKKLTLSEVESRAGLSDGNLSRIERSEQWLSEDKLFAVARALEVHPSELFPSPKLKTLGAERSTGAQGNGQHLVPVLSHDYISAKEVLELIDKYAKSNKTDRDMAMDVVRSGAEKASARSRSSARKKS